LAELKKRASVMAKQQVFIVATKLVVLLLDDVWLLKAEGSNQD
jgi:hypothetical protein